MLPHYATITEHTVKPEEAESNLISPDIGMLLLTWIVFFVLLGILYKFAWKPILTALDSREESIRKSLEDVERIKSEMENIERTREQVINDAEQKASGIIDQSRQAAKEAADIIKTSAREEAQISLENAVREIKEETQKAQMRLREESAEIAVELAGRIIEENMSTDKNRSLIDRFINDL